MNTTIIDCFIETAATGSFTKAAANLYFAQQTVSRCVALLEKELNVSLFDRTAGGLRLTQTGRYYYAIFKSNAYTARNVKENITRYYEKLNSNIRIGCSEWINPYKEIYDALTSFRTINSDIHISMQVFNNNELLNRLIQKELDIAIFSEQILPDSRNFEVIPLCAEDIRLFGPASLMGSELSAEQIEKRKDLTLLIVPAWERGYTETVVYARQEMTGLDIPVKSVRFLPNIASQCMVMQHGTHLAFSDYRFGFLSDMVNLGTEPLEVKSSICACIPLQTENSSVHKLIEHFLSIMK